MSRILAVTGIIAASNVFAANPPPPLLVMLQGQNLSDIRQAAIAAGATITHELPIINAIGARMSEAQLAPLRDHPSIERIIDDLAYAPEPEPLPDCGLSAAIELIWEDDTARWKIYNKLKQPIPLGRLELGWQAGLSELTAVSIGNHEIALPPGGAGQANSYSLANLLAPPGAMNVELSFAPAPLDRQAAQNALDLKVHASEGECSAELVPSYPDPEADSYFPLASGSTRLHDAGITGRGVTIAVMDSGLWEEPAAIRLNTRGEPRIRARYDAIQGREVSVAEDESGHGTHITSVIARSDNAIRGPGQQPAFRGVAPDADIVAVKVFDASGEGGFLDIIRGVQWVLDNRERYGIRVMNLSFASRPRWPYWEDPVNQAMMRAWQAGLVIVASAGNEGPDPMTVGSPGNLPYLITVGAVTDSWTVDDRRDDYLPDFSSRGPTPTGHIKPDLLAYGGHISGYTRPGTTLPLRLPEYLTSSGEFVMTGTSQAAAVISGISALLLQADPDASNDDIKCMLTTAAEPAISADGKLSYSPFAQGAGLVTAHRALTLGQTDCPSLAADIDKDLTGKEHFIGPAIFDPTGEAEPELPDQKRLISPIAPEKGPSENRRWGATEHLERLPSPPVDSPIDWIGVYTEEQARLRALTRDDAN